MKGKSEAQSVQFEEHVRKGGLSTDGRMYAKMAMVGGAGAVIGAAVGAIKGGTVLSALTGAAIGAGVAGGLALAGAIGLALAFIINRTNIYGG